MSPEQFIYWFQGFAELTPNPPDARQWDQIREHVALVFKKVTPPLGYKGNEHKPPAPPPAPPTRIVRDDRPPPAPEGSKSRFFC